MNLLMRSAGLILALYAWSPAQAQEADAEGCKDHPLLNRLPNHYIASCQNTDFDTQDFPLGSRNEDRSAKEVMTVEGTKFIADYQLQQDGSKANSALQAMRNFQNAVKSAGGVVVAEFGAADSGKGLCDPLFGCADHATTLKLSQGSKEIWVLVLPQSDNDGRYTLRISEREVMKQDIATNELVDKINKDGFIALYLNFDTGKATIRPDSKKALDDVATALSSAPNLKIEIGGHTDNVGKADANRVLSEARAQSVLKALAERGIATNRLTAKGYGQDKPVADNTTEDGRAKNRRVELSKR